MGNKLKNAFHVKVSKADDNATIHLSGNFNFLSHPKFKESYLQLLNDSIVNSVAVDFARVEHMDSAALGMLLVLRDRVGGVGKTLTLVRPSSMAQKIFNIANFQRMFIIQ